MCLVGACCLFVLSVSAQAKGDKARQGGVEVQQVQLFPDVPMNEVRLEAVVRVPKAGKYTLTCKRSCYPDEDPEAATIVMPLRLQKGDNEVSVLIDMGENPHLWSEYHPALYRLYITLANKKGVGEKLLETLALRQWDWNDDVAKDVGGRGWTLNGLPVLLRPVDESLLDMPVPNPDAPVAQWHHFFRQAREKGFNHLHRPLEATTAAMLEAADLVGFYLHIDDPDTLGRFTNHPSVMPYEPHSDALRYMAPLTLVAEMADTCLSTDTLKADLLLANFTEDDHRQPVCWQLRSIDADGQPDGHFSADGEEDYVDAWQGGITRITSVIVPLAGIQAPCRLRLTVSTEGATLQRDVEVRKP